MLSQLDVIDARPGYIYASTLALIPECRLLGVSSPLLIDESLELVTERDTKWSPFMREMSHDYTVRAVKFSPNGSWFASGDDKGIVRIWDAVCGRALNVMKDHDKVFGIGWTPDSQRVISASTRNGNVSVWDAATGALLQSRSYVEWEGDHWAGVACSPCGRYFALTDKERVEVRSVDNLDQKVSIIAVRECWHIDFSSDGSQILTSCDDTAPQFWDVKTGSLVKSLESGEEKEIRGAIFLPDGRIAAFPRLSDIVIIWDAESGKHLRTIKGPYGLRIRRMTASHRGGVIAVANSPRDIYLLDVQSGTYFAVMDTQEGRVDSLSFSPDDLRLVSGDDRGRVYLWDLLAFSDHGKAVTVRDYRSRPFAFSPDGSLAAYEAEEQAIVVWDLANRCRLSTLKSREVRVDSIAISNDRKWVAAAARDGTVRIWKTDSGELWKCFEGLENRERVVVFSRDSFRIASVATVDGRSELERAYGLERAHELEVKCWSVSDGNILTEFRTALQLPEQIGGGSDVSLNAVSDFAFSPDGSTLFVEGTFSNFEVQHLLMRCADGEAMNPSQKIWKSQKEIESEAQASFYLTQDGWMVSKKNSKRLFWLPQSERPGEYDENGNRVRKPDFVVYGEYCAFRTRFGRFVVLDMSGPLNAGRNST